MSTQPPEALISAYLEAELSEEQASALSAWVEASRSNARYLASLTVVERGLVQQYNRQSTGNLLAELSEPTVWDSVVDQALAERRRHEIEDEANRQLSAQQAEAARSRRFELRRQTEAVGRPYKPVVIPTPLVWCGFAALLGLVAALAIYFDKPAPSPTTNPPGAPGAVAQAPEIAMPITTHVALIRSSVDAHWVGLANNDNLEGGKTVTLRAGLAEVVFGDGAAVIIQGPATFETVGPNAIRLDAGRIVATIPDSAQGFTVATPGGLITDYGTAFGVIVNHDGQTLAQAFTGRIGLTPIGGDEVDLLAGEAVIATPRGQVREVDHDERAFVRNEEYAARRDAGTSPYARWLAYSYELQRDPAVLAYFVPEGAAFEQAQLPNLGPGSASAATLDGTELVPGRFGEKQALGFASDNDICAFSDDTATDDLTLAAWVWIDRLSTGIAMLMGTEFWETPGATHWQLEIAEDGRTWGMSIGVLPQLGADHAKATSWGILSPSDCGRWVHLAVVVDRSAGQARFFVDGTLRDVLDYQPDIPHRIGNARIGTLRSEGRTSPPHDRHLDGRVDEMAILARPMSDDEVQQMYDAGRPPATRPASR